MSTTEPTFFDLQNNGCYGVDFNSDTLTGEQLYEACVKLEQDHVGGILATIVTGARDRMIHRLSNLVKLRERDPLAKKIIQGIHIEGPFLNETPGYKGAHNAEVMVLADLEFAKELLDAAGGLTRVLTLAPERDPEMKTTRWLTRQGITVSAGHCDASLDQLKAGIDAGLAMYTHLGNGCPMQMHRHDNIVQRVLSLSGKLWLCFIADGAHVAWPALGNYIKLSGMEKTCVVTDAVMVAGLGPGRYKLLHHDVLVSDDMVCWAADKSHLVGAAITMPQTLNNLTRKLGLSRADALRLLCDNPRKSVGL